jgi:CubicO group peptidase (beta-lactamase class C family)
MDMSRVAVAIFALLTLACLAGAQDLTPQIDQIFADLNRPGSPGCSLGVVKDGKFVYRRAYGAASLELGVPLTPQSVFYVGSVSKQFTAASVVLAAEQGFLSLDDDLRKYIPELPDYGHTITLRQMLHQTSGLRDFFDLLYFSGLDPASSSSPAEILKLVVRQKGLNNVPGDDWIYSNTNYFLLGVVVARATKKTLAEFAAENIFGPLGMSHTRFYDDASIVVPNRVAAYDPGNNGTFTVDWSTTYAVVGGGGVMTTVDDLLAWDINFYANRLGKGTLLKELETPSTLNDGSQTTYGMGLFLGNYRGLPTLEHDGALFGYRADLLRFPEQRFTVICLCNLANADPENRSRQVANIYLNGKFPSNPELVAPSAANSFPDPVSFSGRYLDPRTHTIYEFSAKNGELLGWGSVLRRKSANQFYDLSGDVITFAVSNGQMRASIDVNGKAYFSGGRLSEFRLDEATLSPFAGDYRSPELDGKIQIALDQGTLYLKSGTNAPLLLNPIKQDEFEAAGSFALVFHRDAGGRVTALQVFQSAARGISFERVN